MKGGMTINWFDTVDSTQNAVQRQADTLDNLSVIAAREQTAGRGQRGNRWKARPGENLTFSVLLRPGEDGIPCIPVHGQFLVSQAASLAVRDLLREEGIAAAVKWPNDIYVGDRKICGMLIENTLAGDRIRTSVIGIGINVNQSEFDPELMNPTSMKKVTGREFDLPTLLERFCRLFLHRWAQPSEALQGDWLEALYRKDERRSYTDCRSGTVFEGTIKGISESGLLRMEMPDGSICDFGFKEISYIL